MKIESGVDAVFCATHRENREGPLHGHTYQVTAWFPYKGADVQVLRDYLRDELAAFDHSELPQHMTRAEEIARYLLDVLPDCVRVQVNRPLEGFHATAEKD